ncbi:hypothetical protein VNI00_010322 [Paramarasmius palmivorus]|uniref:Uncharacterized protein n=1 Tax=Paramarasmius palmivorus TaxID=297713 RepID=A0AAW0CKE8_9AGAR
MARTKAMLLPLLKPRRDNPYIDMEAESDEEDEEAESDEFESEEETTSARARQRMHDFAAPPILYNTADKLYANIFARYERVEAREAVPSSVGPSQAANTDSTRSHSTSSALGTIPPSSTEIPVQITNVHTNNQRSFLPSKLSQLQEARDRMINESSFNAANARTILDRVMGRGTEAYQAWASHFDQLSESLKEDVIIPEPTVAIEDTQILEDRQAPVPVPYTPTANDTWIWAIDSGRLIGYARHPAINQSTKQFPSVFFAKDRRFAPETLEHTEFDLTQVVENDDQHPDSPHSSDEDHPYHGPEDDPEYQFDTPSPRSFTMDLDPEPAAQSEKGAGPEPSNAQRAAMEVDNPCVTSETLALPVATTSSDQTAGASAEEPAAMEVDDSSKAQVQRTSTWNASSPSTSVSPVRGTLWRPYSCPRALCAPSNPFNISSDDPEDAVLHDDVISALVDIVERPTGESDTTIFQIQCRCGREAAAVFLIMRYLMKRTKNKKEVYILPIVSAYTSSIPGRIYIEIPSAFGLHSGPVQDILKLVPGLQLSSQDSTVVPSSDWSSTLIPRSRMDSIPVGQWVRIVRPGLHEGDVGLVVDDVPATTSTTICHVVVCMVPRIDLTKVSSKKAWKRGDPKPNPRLIDISVLHSHGWEYGRDYEGECLCKDEHPTDHKCPHIILKLAGCTIKYGFVYRAYSVLSLRPASSMPTSLCKWFYGSKNQLILTSLRYSPHPDTWEFFKGERVRAIGHQLETFNIPAIDTGIGSTIVRQFRESFAFREHAALQSAKAWATQVGRQLSGKIPEPLDTLPGPVPYTLSDNWFYSASFPTLINEVRRNNAKEKGHFTEDLPTRIKQVPHAKFVATGSGEGYGLISSSSVSLNGTVAITPEGSTIPVRVNVLYVQKVFDIGNLVQVINPNVPFIVEANPINEHSDEGLPHTALVVGIDRCVVKIQATHLSPFFLLHANSLRRTEEIVQPSAGAGLSLMPISQTIPALIPEGPSDGRVDEITIPKTIVPWVGMSVRIVKGSKFKGQVGTVKTVTRDDSLQSGLRVKLMIDTFGHLGRTEDFDYDFLRREDNHEFLSLPADPYWQLRQGYQRVYSKDETKYFASPMRQKSQAGRVIISAPPVDNSGLATPHHPGSLEDASVWDARIGDNLVPHANFRWLYDNIPRTQLGDHKFKADLHDPIKSRTIHDGYFSTIPNDMNHVLHFGPKVVKRENAMAYPTSALLPARKGISVKNERGLLFVTSGPHAGSFGRRLATRVLRYPFDNERMLLQPVVPATVAEDRQECDDGEPFIIHPKHLVLIRENGEHEKVGNQRLKLARDTHAKAYVDPDELERLDDELVNFNNEPPVSATPSSLEGISRLTLHELRDKARNNPDVRKGLRQILQEGPSDSGTPDSPVASISKDASTNSATMDNTTNPVDDPPQAISATGQEPPAPQATAVPLSLEKESYDRPALLQLREQFCSTGMGVDKAVDQLEDIVPAGPIRTAWISHFSELSEALNEGDSLPENLSMPPNTRSTAQAEAQAGRIHTRRTNTGKLVSLSSLDEPKAVEKKKPTTKKAPKNVARIYEEEEEDSALQDKPALSKKQVHVNDNDAVGEPEDMHASTTGDQDNIEDVEPPTDNNGDQLFQGDPNDKIPSRFLVHPMSSASTPIVKPPVKRLRMSHVELPRVSELPATPSTVTRQSDLSAEEVDPGGDSESDGSNFSSTREELKRRRRHKGQPSESEEEDDSEALENSPHPPLPAREPQRKPGGKAQRPKQSKANQVAAADATRDAGPGQDTIAADVVDSNDDPQALGDFATYQAQIKSDAIRGFIHRNPEYKLPRDRSTSADDVETVILTRSGPLPKVVKVELDQWKARMLWSVQAIANHMNLDVSTCWNYIMQEPITKTRKPNKFNAFQAWHSHHRPKPSGVSAKEYNRKVLLCYLQVKKHSSKSAVDDEEIPNDNDVDVSDIDEVTADFEPEPIEFYLKWYEDMSREAVKQAKSSGRWNPQRVLPPLLNYSEQSLLNHGCHVFGFLIETQRDAQGRSFSCAWGNTPDWFAVRSKHAAHIEAQVFDYEAMFRVEDMDRRGRDIPMQYLTIYREMNASFNDAKDRDRRVWRHIVNAETYLQVGKEVAWDSFLHKAGTIHLRLCNWPKNTSVPGLRGAKPLTLSEYQSFLPDKEEWIRNLLTGQLDEMEQRKPSVVYFEKWTEAEIALQPDEQAYVPIVSLAGKGHLAYACDSKSWKERFGRDFEDLRPTDNVESETVQPVKKYKRRKNQPKANSDDENDDVKKDKRGKSGRTRQMSADNHKEVQKAKGKAKATASADHDTLPVQRKDPYSDVDQVRQQLLIAHHRLQDPRDEFHVGHAHVLCKTLLSSDPVAYQEWVEHFNELNEPLNDDIIPVPPAIPNDGDHCILSPPLRDSSPLPSNIPRIDLAVQSKKAVRRARERSESLSPPPPNQLALADRNLNPPLSPLPPMPPMPVLDPNGPPILMHSREHFLAASKVPINPDYLDPLIHPAANYPLPLPNRVAPPLPPNKPSRPKPPLPPNKPTVKPRHVLVPALPTKRSFEDVDFDADDGAPVAGPSRRRY